MWEPKSTAYIFIFLKFAILYHFNWKVVYIVTNGVTNSYWLMIDPISGFNEKND